MRGSERFWHRARRAGTLAYTALMRGRFARFGAGSVLERRARLDNPWLVDVGERVVLCESLWLNAKDDRGDGQPTLRIGDGSYFGRMCQVNAWREVWIGREVLIADRVFIGDSSHVYDDPSRAVLLQGDRFVAPVRLEDGCWIGVGATILPGVTVGRNAVVAAGAVVTRSVPDHAVVAGVPARILGAEATQ